MTKSSNSPVQYQIAYKVLVFASLAIAFIQISLGAFVRSTESGLGCPDWPLCHGELIPPFEFHTLIEYSHRLNGSILGIFIVALALSALLKYRNNKSILCLSLVSLFLVILAGILGGITVITELSWWIRLIHLSIALLLICCITLLAKEIVFPNRTHMPVVTKEIWKTSGAILIVFIVIISGSFMIGIGANASCATWPLCRGSFFPSGYEYLVHMSHRYLAVASLIFLIYTALSVYKANPLREIRKTGHIVVGLTGVQILVGAVMVYTGFSPHLKWTHLSLATLILMSSVFFLSTVHSSEGPE
mgnify:CR=1 FL=1